MLIVSNQSIVSHFLKTILVSLCNLHERVGNVAWIRQEGNTHREFLLENTHCLDKDKNEIVTVVIIKIIIMKHISEKYVVVLITSSGLWV